MLAYEVLLAVIDEVSVWILEILEGTFLDCGANNFTILGAIIYQFRRGTILELYRTSSVSNPVIVSNIFIYNIVISWAKAPALYVTMSQAAVEGHF